PAEAVVPSVEPAVEMASIEMAPTELAPTELAMPLTAAATDTASLEPVTAPDAISPEPAPSADMLEGVAAVWDQLTRADVERVKRELGVRRAELLSRHAEELRALDAAQTEIDTLEQTIDAFARKFNIPGSEVVVPFEGDRNSRGQGRV